MNTPTSSEKRVAPAEWINGRDTGCVLKDRYALREVRGAGGFAAVYRAQDLAFTALEVSVAVKLAHDRLSAKDRRRFEREANVAAQLNHPNIVRVLDYGVLDGRPWFVMPLLTGVSLHLRRGGHWLDMARLMQQLCSAVDGMHRGTSLSAPGLRTQVLHRDIKPLNCFVTEREHCEPHLTLLDLGLCKLPGVQRLTSVGTVLGTSAYMAPECLVGAVPSTIRSEVYSLGVTLFELLTGELPDRADCVRGLTDDTVRAPDPRALRPEIPATLAAIVMRAMDPQLSRRFASVGEMATAIAAVVGRVRRAPVVHPRETRALHLVPALELASQGTVLAADTRPEAVVIPLRPGPPRAPRPADAAATPPRAEPPLAPRPADVADVRAPVEPRARGWARWSAVTVCAAVVALALRPALPAPATARSVTPDDQDTASMVARTYFVPDLVAPHTDEVAASIETARARTHAHGPATRARGFTAAEATVFAERALPELRTCDRVPHVVTAELAIVRGRAVVETLNALAPAADDPLFPWHPCARRSLEAVRFPERKAAARVRVRLVLGSTPPGPGDIVGATTTL